MQYLGLYFYCCGESIKVNDSFGLKTISVWFGCLAPAGGKWEPPGNMFRGIKKKKLLYQCNTNINSQSEGNSYEYIRNFHNLRIIHLVYGSIHYTVVHIHEDCILKGKSLRVIQSLSKVPWNKCIFEDPTKNRKRKINYVHVFPTVMCKNGKS